MLAQAGPVHVQNLWRQLHWLLLHNSRACHCTGDGGFTTLLTSSTATACGECSQSKLPSLVSVQAPRGDAPAAQVAKGLSSQRQQELAQRAACHCSTAIA